MTISPILTIGDAIAEAIEALEKAKKQFAFYAEHHRAKGAADKAATNDGYALMCGHALEHLQLVAAFGTAAAATSGT